MIPQLYPSDYPFETTPLPVINFQSATPPVDVLASVSILDRISNPEISAATLHFGIALGPGRAVVIEAVKGGNRCLLPILLDQPCDWQEAAKEIGIPIGELALLLEESHPTVH